MQAQMSLLAELSISLVVAFYKDVAPAGALKDRYGRRRRDGPTRDCKFHIEISKRGAERKDGDGASRLPAYKKPRPTVHRARQATWPELSRCEP